MNDVEKTNIHRKNSGKRMRRRKRMMSAYILVVVLLVVTVGATMCYTFLFNIDKIVISGESVTYEYMEIVDASEIEAGDNLLRTNTDKAEQRILDKLRYVETATIGKDFPSTLKINVTRCIPAYNIQHDEGVLLVSRKGKILEDKTTYTDIDELPIIYGLEPSDNTLGTFLKSKNENKYDAFVQIISRFDRDDNRKIKTIDLTNEYDIIVTYRDGLVFRMGNWSDVDYKLDLAQNVMEDESIKGKSGYLMMIGSNQCSFRLNSEKELMVTTSTITDSFGIDETVTTVAPEGENPDDPYVHGF